MRRERERERERERMKGGLYSALWKSLSQFLPMKKRLSGTINSSNCPKRSHLMYIILRWKYIFFWKEFIWIKVNIWGFQFPAVKMLLNFTFHLKLLSIFNIWRSYRILNKNHMFYNILTIFIRLTKRWVSPELSFLILE